MEKVSKKQVNKFINRIKALELHKDFHRNGYTELSRCEEGCTVSHYIVKVKNKDSVLLENDTNLRAIQIKTLLQEFFGLQQFLCDLDVGEDKAKCTHNEIDS